MQRSPTPLIYCIHICTTRNIFFNGFNVSITGGHKEIAELLIIKGANVNAKLATDETPLDNAINHGYPETANLLRKHGGKTGEELKAEGKWIP